MPTSLNAVLYDQAIEISLDGIKMAESGGRKAIAILRDAEKELAATIIGGNPTSKARAEKAISEIRAAIKSIYAEIGTIGADSAGAIAEASASSTVAALSTATAGAVTVTKLTAPVISAISSGALINGAAQSEWWSRQSADLAFRFSAMVRQGLADGRTPAQMAGSVADLMQAPRRNARALIHSAVSSANNSARSAVYAENADIISAVEWRATLDMRVCIQCAVMDGKRWTVDGKPIGHSVPYAQPPIHFNDRCVMVPVLRSFADLGIDLADLPPGKRASAEGQVSDRTFGEWLTRKDGADPGFADRVLGKGRAKLWRDKTITFDQLLTGGKELTLQDLRQKYQ